jgi:hypothetical protein
MSKVFWIATAVLVVGFGTIITIGQISKLKQGPLLGIQHDDQGGSHISGGQKHVAYNSDLASSGPHYANSVSPTGWGVYGQEIPPEVYIHNEEHGGIVIAYQPDLLSADNIAKLKKLVLPPYSNPSFSPRKIIVMPMASSTRALELASWRYTLKLDNYDEATIIKFFTQHAGKSPEPLGAPNNAPIDRSAVN